MIKQEIPELDPKGLPVCDFAAIVMWFFIVIPLLTGNGFVWIPWASVGFSCCGVCRPLPRSVLSTAMGALRDVDERCRKPGVLGCVLPNPVTIWFGVSEFRIDLLRRRWDRVILSCGLTIRILNIWKTVLMIDLIKDLWDFMRVRKFWLANHHRVVIVGCIDCFAQGGRSAIVYTIFWDSRRFRTTLLRPTA